MDEELPLVDNSGDEGVAPSRPIGQAPASNNGSVPDNNQEEDMQDSDNQNVRDDIVEHEVFKFKTFR